MYFQPFTTKMHSEGKPFSHKCILGSFYHKIKKKKIHNGKACSIQHDLNNFVCFPDEKVTPRIHFIESIHILLPRPEHCDQWT